MGLGKDKTEKGQGGKLGHSNRDGWEGHDEAKEFSKKQKRLLSKKLIQEERLKLNKN